MNIADYIEKRLTYFNDKWNEVNGGVKVPNEKNYAARVANMIDKLNKNMGKISVSVDGIDCKSSAIEVPEALRQNKQVVFESLGGILGLEIN